MEFLFSNKSLGTNGRLGNQLFQIASGMGIAQENKTGIVFPEWEYAKYFANPVAQTLNPENIIKRYEEPCFQYLPFSMERAFPVRPDQPGEGGKYNYIDLRGYFQSEKYWKNHKDFVMRYFEFEKEFKSSTEVLMKDIKATNPNTPIYSIHLRFGDYQGNIYYADQKLNGYYNRAIDHALKSWSEQTPLFLLFSDDKKAAAEYVDTIKTEIEKFNYLIITTSSEIKDLCLMSLCSGHIIANSSFSWWGSYLSGSKKVTAPAKWFGDVAGLDTKDLYLEHMVKL